jgi:prepilin-type N-terminal cleavage/methylation domain-containing protein
MGRKAFTLIELLTVIAILAILAAILMPVFVQVRNYAQKYVAGQSMQKLSTVTSMYMSDYDDTYPLAYYPLDNNRRQNWFGVVDADGEVDPDTSLLRMYIKGKIQPDAALNARPWQGDKTGYGYNWGYLGSDFYVQGGQTTWLACANPAIGSSLGEPADTYVYGTSIFFFASWLEGGDNVAYRYGFIDPPKTWFGNPTMDFRHMGVRTVDEHRHEVTSTGEALVVFADGHLRSVSQKEVKNKAFMRNPEWEEEEE